MGVKPDGSAGASGEYGRMRKLRIDIRETPVLE